MDNDIVPALLESIRNDFDQRAFNSTKLKTAVQLLKNKKATYIDVNDYSVEIGQILAEVLGANVTAELLPDGRMYFNIADRVINETLQKNYDLIVGYANDVQTQLNRDANIHMRAQVPDINQDRVDGIINRVSSEPEFDKIKWLLNEPIVTFSQSVVDDVLQSNVEFQAKSGLRPKITRRVVGKACKWCSSLAGSYDYFDKPEEIYQRHERCRCTVEYDPGSGRRQDVWSKKWVDPQRETKIEARKQLNIKKKTPAPSA